VRARPIVSRPAVIVTLASFRGAVVRASMTRPRRSTVARSGPRQCEARAIPRQIRPPFGLALPPQ
jgi:hypothetical protein